MKKIVLIIIVVILSGIAYTTINLNDEKKELNIDQNKVSATATEQTTIYNEKIQIKQLLHLNRLSTIALTTDSTLYGVGSNSYGQLGIGNKSSVSVFTKVLDSTDGTFINGETNIIDIAVSDSDLNRGVLILTEEGNVYAFGDNGYGQLGTGVNTNTNQPTLISSSADGSFVSGTTKVVSISKASEHSVIVTETGNVYTFGSNLNSKLGTGDTLNSSIPKLVANSADGTTFVNGVTKIKKAYATDQTTLMLGTDDTIYTFGYGAAGRLGNGDVFGTNQARPVLVANSADGTFVNGETKIAKIIADDWNTNFITADGILYGFGSNVHGQIGVGITGAVNAPKLVASSADGSFISGTTKVVDMISEIYFRVFQADNGKIYGLGRDNFGELGNGAFYTDEYSPKPFENNDGFINGETEIAEIKTAYSTTFVLTTDGYVYGVGRNTEGQLGIGDNTNKNLLRKVIDSDEYNSANTNITHISCHSYGTMLVADDFEIYTFGDDDYGTFGMNTTNIIHNTAKKTITDKYKIAVTGVAVTHGSEIDIAYNSSVILSTFFGTSAYVQENQGISESAFLPTDGIDKTYSIGDGVNYIVNNDEEKKYTLTVTPIIDPDEVKTITFYIDKKAPRLLALAPSGLGTVCVVDENTGVKYCNEELTIDVIDLTNVASVIMQIEGELPVDKTADFLQSGSLFYTFIDASAKNEEYKAKTYTITDYAGNQSSITVVLDNSNPRIEIN